MGTVARRAALLAAVLAVFAASLAASYTLYTPPPPPPAVIVLHDMAPGLHRVNVTVTGAGYDVLRAGRDIVVVVGVNGGFTEANVVVEVDGDRLLDAVVHPGAIVELWPTRLCRVAPPKPPIPLPPG